jgi:Na+-driven multidrug efflux pump
LLLISCFAFSVLLSRVFDVKLVLGLTGCWIAFAADEIFRGTTYIMR